MGLWGEQYAALVIVAGMLLETMNAVDLQDQLKRLSNACKNSKHKRLPQMCFFSSA
jgi:hypothetical protein